MVVSYEPWPWRPEGLWTHLGVEGGLVRLGRGRALASVASELDDLANDILGVGESSLVGTSPQLLRNRRLPLLRRHVHVLIIVLIRSRRDRVLHLCPHGELLCVDPPGGALADEHLGEGGYA